MSCCAAGVCSRLPSINPFACTFKPETIQTGNRAPITIYSVDIIYWNLTTNRSLGVINHVIFFFFFIFFLYLFIYFFLSTVIFYFMHRFGFFKLFSGIECFAHFSGILLGTTSPGFLKILWIAHDFVSPKVFKVSFEYLVY